MVYRRDEFPDRFHYKAGKFVSTMTLVAEPGWFITEASVAISQLLLFSKLLNFVIMWQVSCVY